MDNKFVCGCFDPNQKGPNGAPFAIVMSLGYLRVVDFAKIKRIGLG